jgi:hypothetical protein
MHTNVQFGCLFCVMLRKDALFQVRITRRYEPAMLIRESSIVHSLFEEVLKVVEYKTKSKVQSRLVSGVFFGSGAPN